jgi:hypothetical protein
MGILFVLAISIPIVWCIVSTARAVARAHQAKWWSAFAVLVVLGLALGWLGENAEYHAGENFRIAGFPIPMGFFHRENGAWPDFPLPGYVCWPGLLINLLAGVATLLLPFRFFLLKK